MSRVLIGSMRSLIPSPASRSAAKRRLLTNVSRTLSEGTSFGVRPARQLSCLQPSAFAYSMALPTPSWNSPTRAGSTALPRSPAAQLPAGRLCSTCVSFAALSFSATCAAGATYGKRYSTPVKPALAAAAKRSRNSTSLNMSVRFAQNFGMVCSFEAPTVS